MEISWGRLWLFRPLTDLKTMPAPCAARDLAHPPKSAHHQVHGAVRFRLGITVGHQHAHRADSIAELVRLQLEARALAGEARLAVEDLETPRQQMRHFAACDKLPQRRLLEQPRIDQRVDVLVGVGVWCMAGRCIAAPLRAETRKPTGHAPPRKAMEILKAEFPTGPAAAFHEFFQVGKRGFVQERRISGKATLKLVDPAQDSDQQSESRRREAA